TAFRAGLFARPQHCGNRLRCWSDASCSSQCSFYELTDASIQIRDRPRVDFVTSAPASLAIAFSTTSSTCVDVTHPVGMCCTMYSHLQARSEPQLQFFNHIAYRICAAPDTTPIYNDLVVVSYKITPSTTFSDACGDC